MSYLAIDEIRGKTSGTPTDVNDLKYQLATAWVNFNGLGTVAIRDSYNVSSITDNNTGNYTVNFATSMDTDNFVPLFSVERNSGEATNRLANLNAQDPITVNAFGVICRTTNGTLVDMSYVLVSTFGGKT